ncbi:MAG TPA: beta-propeller fold lactonase family protein [Terriglobales bacterium]|nr:beta-propeller fold lactonase family protein [Terriglobales bacterium]
MQFRKTSLFHILGMATTFAMLMLMANASVAQTSSAGFVYVATNQPTGNAVVQFARHSNGSLTKIREVATGGLGGTGNGVGPLDPLGSQDSLVLSGTGSLLLVVNAGSNQVSSLAAGAAGLHLLSTVTSGGSFPNSVALHGNLVYVLNAHGTPNISGFRVSSTGTLHPIAGSTRNLPGGTAAGAHDIRFTPDGTRLLVSEGGTNRIDIFQLGSSGLVTEVNTQSSAGSGPFGIRFGRDGVLVNAEANSNSVSSYALSDDTLTVISPAVANGQAATCWISVTADGKFGFTSNTGAGDLSSYQISGNGTVNLVQAVAATAGGGRPIDSAFSSDNAFLYAVDTALGRVLIYAVHGASLALIGDAAGLPTTVQGVAAD